MVAYLRASVRLLLFFLYTLLTVILVSLGNIFLGLFNKKWTVSWKNVIIKSWAWVTGYIVGLRLEKKGTPPEPPFFLVSNHLSYIDVVLLWRYVDATFVAKSEIKSWPFFGWGTRTLGVLFIDRELKRDVHRMNKRISEVISDRQGIVIFPEGTSTRGAEVLPFNAPLLQYPVDGQLPVSYATLSYRTSNPENLAHLDICWWGDMEFFPHLWHLLQLKSFEATITFGEHSIIEDDRKELAKKLHQAVQSNFVPVFAKSTS